ncbi:carbohydrate ABC transporter permease [Amylibacter sp.]|jgi:multiple sugar transport system permease protein|nr:carbohydrate ABC transporter permease [Rhodobacterales bacterium]MDA9236529.1 carbohydrate ABC transporter permease [Amylibacter sp.]MBT4471585.1 carbohydrate ABC transporter permease [Rhodobacterales bacterium]MBT6008049.1 carbohydrate ABC transporter permease [Rhodobacterales bacterium]MBT6833477.1 carbohydrate ABC transporter permease [Rhodobacterales bacterium]|tara:strand:+ start:4798 stop:5646 length:849 start_codon:yes stop_codon:yes gene_type:complete
MFPKPIENTNILTQSVYKTALPIVLILWLLPLIAVALTSVRSGGDLISGNYWGWPTSFDLYENYTSVFKNTPLAQYMWNSFRVTIPTVFGAVALSCMTGFALAVYNFKGNILIFFLFIAGNFVPFQILMVPVRDLSVQMGVYNSVWALILFHIAFQAGFCTLFMRNFIKALPRELIEAARVEGVNEFQIFWYIVIPLMKPAIAALSVLIFTFIWNDYFWATVLTQGVDSQPVTAGLYSLNGQWISQWHLVSAGSIVAALPPVLMFFTMQKHFIAGLTLGAVK